MKTRSPATRGVNGFSFIPFLITTSPFPGALVLAAVLALLSGCQSRVLSDFDLTMSAAVAGDIDAQRKLGTMYYYGHGADQDFGEAIKWIAASAEGGSAGAQYDLAEMYRQGIGTAPNDQVAIRWYTAAADQGHAGAKTLLNFMTGDRPQIESIAQVLPAR